MTRASNRGTFLLAMSFLFLVGLAALMLLGGALGGGTITVARQQQVAAVPEWLRNQRASIPGGLTINGHAAKHLGQKLDAWRLYALLLEGKCVASAKFCDGDGDGELYLCVDPATRAVGGLIRLGDRVITGYAGDLEYWERKINRNFWEVCPDGGE